MRNETANIKYLLDFIKRRSKAHQKNMTYKSTLNFSQWKTVSENHKPISVWLLLVYKINGNNCRLGLFTEFIWTPKTYPTSLDNISITAQKMKFSIKNFCSKCDQIRKDLNHIYWRNPEWKTSFLVQCILTCGPLVLSS